MIKKHQKLKPLYFSYLKLKFRENMITVILSEPHAVRVMTLPNLPIPVKCFDNNTSIYYRNFICAIFCNTVFLVTKHASVIIFRKIEPNL